MSIISNTKQHKIEQFDPNGLGVRSGSLFGLPFTKEESEIIIVPVPWEVTVSYSAGTAHGPQAISDASLQVDLYETEIADAWKTGIYLDELEEDVAEQSEVLREKARKYIDWLEEGNNPATDNAFASTLKEIDEAGFSLKKQLKSHITYLLEEGKMIGLIGGDHSTPLGLYEALADKYPKYGILHIDAHADLRNAYEGFTYSHASIMFNALEIKSINRIVQVGIRDQAESEAEIVRNSQGRVMQFTDAQLRNEQFEGSNWAQQCKHIIKNLPDLVHISFDIDGLDPKLCPDTGTPVPGGFEFAEAVYLIRELAKSGKKIIGFDLVEVAPGTSEWNGNVGARLLYKLCNYMAVSQQKLLLKS